MTANNISGYAFINAILENHFAIDIWGLIYWEVDKNKVVNEYRLKKILLDDN